MPPGAGGKRRLTIPPGVLLLLIGLCVLGTALLVATTGGIVAGQKERAAVATQTTTADFSIQFQLGLADLNEGRYELAVQRFQWIVDRAPQYPGAADNLAQAQALLANPPATAPTAIPTSSAQNLDDRFAEAQAAYTAQDYETAIARLREIQAIDPTYRTVDVKQMLYNSLKTLGVSYVRGDRIEEGIILLDQAETIKPLDDLTAGERNLATLYVTGKTYWSLNWPIVIQNYEAIYQVAPNYRDVASGLWEAYVNYGDQLVVTGQPCDGVDQYQNALNLRSDPAVVDKHNQAMDACQNPSPTPFGTQEGTPGTPPPTDEFSTGGTISTPTYNPSGTIPTPTYNPNGTIPTPTP